MHFFSILKNKCCYEIDKIRRHRNEHAVAVYFSQQRVLSIDETLEKLLHSQCSMCRYGDGEYKVMAGIGNGFQSADPKLAKRLKEIIKRNSNDNLIVCIPNLKEDMNIRTPEASSFWKSFIKEYGRKWISFLNPDTVYFNAHVTRLYYDYQNSGNCKRWFDSLRQIWNNKDLLIVEGEKTKLGVGNDLFAQANSIKRIIAPSQNAFSHYDEILASVKQYWNGELVLVALGQTATVLSYDLCNIGIRTLDVGHIDIEYMWFLSETKVKIPIEGKYVKEVDEQIEVSVTDTQYESQIIAKIGV